MRLILASQSMARGALLTAAGYTFQTVFSNVVEPEPGENAHLEHHVLELAILKAKAVAARHPDAVVIGADTALILGHHIIGKPGSLAGAVRLLSALCGRTHRISSAACVIFPSTGSGKGRNMARLVDTAYVRLRRWTPERIRKHVAVTRPLAWAGAYAIQDPLSVAIVERIEGDPATVIGLPMKQLDRVLRR